MDGSPSTASASGLESIKEEITTIETLGINIAKTVFQLHGVNCNGRVVLKRRVMPEGSWMARMLARKPRKLVAVALTKKMARIVRMLMTKKETYRNRETDAA